MDLAGKLRKGMRIVGSDDREYGTIDRYDDQYTYVGGRRIPVSAFERMDADRLYVGTEGMQYFDTTGQTTDRGEIRVPVREERLQVEKREGELGSVEIHKEVTQERVDVPVELRRERVNVDRHEVADRPAAPGEMDDAFKEGTIRVPLHGEEAVVNKQAVVTGEVVLDRQVETERRTISDTVRREEVGVDHDKEVPTQHSTGGVPHWDDVRNERRRAWEQRAGSSGSRWQDVESGHHYAHEMSADPRYQGRSWREVEPELQAGYGDWSRRRGYMADDDPWARLHREVEEAWEQSRQGTPGRR